jgi:hypothetical protein
MAANGNRSPIVDRITRLRERPFRRESGSTLPVAALTMVFAACLTIAVSADASFEGPGSKTDSDKDNAHRSSADQIDGTAGMEATDANDSDASLAGHQSRSADHASRQHAENADKDRDRETGDGERSQARNAAPIGPSTWSINFTDPQNSIPKAIGRVAWSTSRAATPSPFRSAVYQPDIENVFEIGVEADEDGCPDKDAAAERRRERARERAEAAHEREMAQHEARMERAEAARERELERLEERLEREAEAREEELERIMQRVEDQVAEAHAVAGSETHRALERARIAAASARSRAERARAISEYSRVRQRNRVPAPPEPPVAPVAPVVTISFATPTQQGTFRLTPAG